MKYPRIIVPFIRAEGMALFPFILLRKKTSRGDAVLINHELIHLKQQLELLIIPFYVAYGINYIVNLLKYRHHDRAYKNIIFEREAYKNEDNLSYLKVRGFCEWRKYLRNY